MIILRLMSRLHLLGLGLVVMGCTAVPPPFLDKDLTPHSPDEREAGLSLGTGLGFPTAEDFHGYLAYVTDLRNDRGELRRTLVWLEPASKVPGYCRIRIGVLSPDGRRLDDSTFLGGWRHIEFTGVAKILRPMAPDLLLIRSEGMVIPHRRFTYAMAGDRIELVRLEAEEPPKADTNYYRSPNHTVGPVYPPTDENDVLRILQGESWTRRLSTLLWLTGVHYDGTDPHLWHEDEKTAALALRLQDSLRVHAAIESLTHDSDDWTREAAALALNR